jgi:CheY-like chemotaxis protein
MNGEIGVISDGDHGSTVWFSALLTRVSVPKPTLVVNSPSRNAANRKARILVVDDVDLNLEIVEAYLSQGGFGVDTAAGAREAIRMLLVETYDLVLMDIQMPEMDGVAATRCIRSMADWRKYIPIIAMTGNVLPEQLQGFLEAGMDGHISKPIELAALYKNVQRWLPGTDPAEMNVTPTSHICSRFRTSPCGPAATPNE